MPTIYRYYFRDSWTNEVFPVESSFAIETQALERHPKYALARLEYGMGRGDPPWKRFELVPPEMVENAEGRR